jgi:hypothetical protein
LRLLRPSREMRRRLHWPGRLSPVVKDGLAQGAAEQDQVGGGDVGAQQAGVHAAGALRLTLTGPLTGPLPSRGTTPARTGHARVACPGPSHFSYEGRIP